MEIRKVSLLVLLFSFLLNAGVFAGGNPDSHNTALRNKIIKLIDNPDLAALNGDQFTAEIEFIVTRKNEVLVVGVNANDIFFDSYIKEKLNYRPVKIRGVQQMTPYRIEVTFQRPSTDEEVPDGRMALVSWR